MATNIAASDLPKMYDPVAVEAAAYRTWLEERCFAADPGNPAAPYSIVIPPPNVTGALHLGHAINNTLQDILTRVHRMRGFNTLWVPGIDHAGIATQAVVEKQLKEKENKTRHDVGREGLVERIWAWKEQYGDRILNQLKALGCSCDWERTRFTLDEMCARAVRETFFKLFKDGLIYRGKRLVNWDIHLQTSISDDEIYHETVKTFLWHIAYPIVNEDGSAVGSGQSAVNAARLPTADRGLPTFMTVATTRPETMLGDTAVAVHSEDARWNWAIGKKVRLPLTDRLIPIIADDILVDPKFGSGVVKVTPAHDPNDYAVWQRHQGKGDAIDIINILNSDGTLNAAAGGKYAGMKRDKARAAVVEELKAAGLLVKEEPYETQVGHSDRSKTPVEPYLSDQWFVKMAPLAEPALQVVREGKIKFYPERHAQQYLSWLGEKRDWPISRQLWWGHRIPVWTHRSFPGGVTAEEPIAIYEQLTEWESEGRIAHATRNEGDPTRSPGSEWMRRFICVRDQADCDIVDYLEQHGFVQDPDVLDTWFSSALWPHSTLGWPEANPWLEKYYPTSVLLTGRDIITLWVARMVMTGIYNMGEVPFHDVAINPTILDGKGERMSKSKGNGVDPLDIIHTHGADALRFTLATMATETQDVRLPVKKLPDGRNTSEKFDLGRNFANKLWNACRFALSNLESAPSEAVDEGKWSMADRWIVSRFNRTVAEADEALRNYRFDVYARACYAFFWDDFCDWYVEAIKPAMKDAARAGQTANVLAAVLDGALRLLHPVIPFITETIWWRLNEVRPVRGLAGWVECEASKRLILAKWPTPSQSDDGTERDFGKLQLIIGAIRNIRNDYKVDAKKIVGASIQTGAVAPSLINDNRAMIELLGLCTVTQVGGTMSFTGVPGVASAAGCDIYVQVPADLNADRERVEKRRQELTKQIGMLEGRLANPGYVAKAPAALIEQTREQLAAAKGELGKLG